MDTNKGQEIILYRSADGKSSVALFARDESVWLNQIQLAELFDTSKQNISTHIRNIFKDKELDKNSVVKEYLTTASDGKPYNVKFYSLEMILAIGFRVRSIRGVQFRQWANDNLKDFLKKGFLIDDERLKNPGGRPDYFDELLARIRDIRASEKRFYQKVRDLFKLSSDYDATDKSTQMFYAETQNKLLFAVTGKTAAEIIVSRAKDSEPNMGLTSWKGTIVRKQDILIAKNYLTEDEIDSLNLISASFGLWGGGNNSNGESNYVGNSPLDNHLLYQYGIGSHSKSSWYSIDGGIDYQRLSPTIKGRMFTLSYKVNTRPQTSDSYSEYDIAYGHDDWTDYLRRLEDQHNDGSQNTTEHTFQADYTTPIGKLHTIESGVKYILRNNSSDNDRYLRTAADNSDYVFDEEYSTHYRHQNDIIAAYLGYGLKWKKLSGRLGVRYEHTIEDVKYLLGRGDDFRKNYDDVVPSASLGWKLTDLSNLRLGYNMRIYRPGIWYLNPYLNDSNPSSLSQGNPELDSEKSHAFDLSYSNFTPKFNINVSARYSFTNNSIQSVTSLVSEDDIPDLSEDKKTGKDVLYTTYQNIGKSRNLNLSAYVNWNATKDTRVYANLFGGYTSLKGANGLENDGWNLFAYGGAQQTFKHDWRLSMNIFGQTPWIMLQGKGSSFFSYSLNLNKSFMNRRLSLSAFASNFFQKYNKFKSHIEGQGFIQDSWNKYPQMRFGLSVSYRIGELKASVKKAARTITNDDVKSGGGSGAAGGGGGE